MNRSNEQSDTATKALLDTRTRLTIAGFSVVCGLAALWVVNLRDVVSTPVSLVFASWAVGGLIVAARGVVTRRSDG